MNLKILLPTEVLVEVDHVARVVAETSVGALGLLPRRLDCVASLVPGILTWQVEGGAEAYAAVDEGVLVKAGADVRVSVRRAHVGVDLAALHAAVVREFTTLDACEAEGRRVLARLETGFLHRFAALRHD